MKVTSASVVICTYNRAALLRDTLAAMQQMAAPPACAVEIIVVDNNSGDDTPTVIAEAARSGPFPVVALRERSQGKSFGLNAALDAAGGDILALTDDDVVPAVDWLQRIVEDFRAHDVAFVFGKVLPRWECEPPKDLLRPRAQDIWGPLALVDYGDAPVLYTPDKTGQRLPIGANLAFSRDVLLRVGGWRTDLGKANNTLIAGEDHEIFLQLLRHGLYGGYYDPAVTVGHLVPAVRLSPRYFRRWFFWHGKTQALMLDDLYPELDMTRVPRVAGVPRFAYRQAFEQAWRWLRTRRGDRLIAFIEELLLIRYFGLFLECWRQEWRRRLRPAAAPETRWRGVCDEAGRLRRLRGNSGSGFPL